MYNPQRFPIGCFESLVFNQDGRGRNELECDLRVYFFASGQVLRLHYERLMISMYVCAC